MFYSSVVLFDEIVQVLAASNSNSLWQLALRSQFRNCSVRCSIGIERNLGRNPLALHGLSEKRFGRVHVPVPAQIIIDGLAGFVHRPVEVDPRALHLYIRLITAPGAAHSTGVSSPSLLKLRTVMLYPPQNCGVRHGDAT